MLFPYFLDLIPEKLGKLYAKFFDWTPEGNRVLLRVTEGEAGFYGSVVYGTIVHIEYAAVTSKSAGGNPSVLIRLDIPWNYENRTTSTTNWVMVVPRFYGHGVHRLLITSSDVHVFPVSNPEPPHTFMWEDMIAICEMKLTRGSTPTAKA